LSKAFGLKFHLHPQREHRHPAGQVHQVPDEAAQHLQHHHPILDNEGLQDEDEDDNVYDEGGGDPNEDREDQLVLDVQDAMDEEAKI